MLSLPVQNADPADPADPAAPLPGTAGFFCISQKKFRRDVNIFGQSAIKYNEKIGTCKIAISLTKCGGGIIAILSIFGSNVQDLFCILQNSCSRTGQG